MASNQYMNEDNAQLAHFSTLGHLGRTQAFELNLQLRIHERLGKIITLLEGLVEVQHHSQ